MKIDATKLKTLRQEKAWTLKKTWLSELTPLPEPFKERKQVPNN